MLNIVNDPQVIKDVFSENDFKRLKEYLINKPKSDMYYEPDFGRYILKNEFIESFSEILLPYAKKIFNNENIVSSYSLFAHYEGKDAQLFKHLDNNACTYTVDTCIYQNDTWDLWVEGKPYTLHPNEALAYYGNDQLHWRESFPNPEFQHVAMIFFHFVDKNHWYITKGPTYVDVIRGIISEEEWSVKNGI